MSAEPSILWFEEVGAADVPRVGGKNASLGEMVRALSGAGVRVPPALPPRPPPTARLWPAAASAARCRHGSTRSGAARRACAETGAAIRRLILDAGIPAALADEIRAAYRKLAERRGVAEAGGGGAQQRDRRGPAECELRRAAGNLPQRRAAKRRCWMPAGTATPRCSPTGRSATATCRASTT